MNTPHSLPRRVFLLSLLLPACAYWQQADGEVQPKTAGATAVATSDPPAPPAQLGQPQPSDADAPVRLVGSTTIGQTIAPRLASAFLAKMGAKSIETQEASGKTTVSGVGPHGRIAFEIDAPGSSAAFDCLAKSTCEVGMSSRPIQQDEISKLASLGDMTSDAAEHVLALDGIAVIVNRANTLDKVTVQQVASVFTGATPSLASKELHVVSRDKQSGTYESFVQLALGGKDVTDRAHLVSSGEDVSTAVAKDELAIGFVGLAQVGSNRALAVQDGKGPARAPTLATISTEDYPFTRRLFFYTPEHPQRPIVHDFVEFSLSDEGQQLIDQTGFVSLNIKATPAASPQDAPEAYSKWTTGGQRLSFNFRFRAGGAALESKSIRDIDRMSRFIRAAASRPRVALFGFTDDRGDGQKDIEVSRQRAKVVADALKKKGIDTDIVEGFGSVLPVASNDTPAGRMRNTRVEVWLH
jgi:phosphate transport system substrate-binding protein